MKWILKYGGIITGATGVAATFCIIWGLVLAMQAVFVYTEYRAATLILAAYSFGAGIFCLCFVCIVHWERIMKLGIVERVLERRRIAAAASTMKNYQESIC